MTMIQTYTLAAVPVSQEAYDEVTRALKKSGAERPFNYPDRIDMQGLCLTVKDPPNRFAAKLKEGGLTTAQIEVVLSTVEAICTQCWDALPGCHCMNDE